MTPVPIATVEELIQPCDPSFGALFCLPAVQLWYHWKGNIDQCRRWLACLGWLGCCCLNKAGSLANLLWHCSQQVGLCSTKQSWCHFQQPLCGGAGPAS